MRINLSKKNKIIVIAILFVVLGGTGGYLLWRVNQDKTVAPTDSDAGCITVGTGPCSAVNAVYGGNCPEGKIGCGSGMGNPGAGKAWCQDTATSCTADCGDGSCNGSETVASCPQDCAKCGDNVCSTTESLASCPGDCAKCGDNVCTSPTETLANCPGDCAKCGDKICTSPTETIVNCADDCSKCGDGICNTLTETSNTCASDCACKAMVWGNKPSGAYKPNVVTTLSPITIVNPNMTGAVNKGIAIKLNDTALTQCGSATGASCYTMSTNSTNQQLISLTLFGGQATIAEGTYTISVTLPGVGGSCVESTSFTIAADAVVVPETGIFDGVMSKIYLGTGFVFLGIMTTQFSKFGYLFNTIGEKNRVVLEEKKRKREENKRNRFERRFK